MKKRILLFAITIIAAGGNILLAHAQTPTSTPPTAAAIAESLTIEKLRAKSYPGSDLVIEETLPASSTYHQYIASYYSDGLKIRGLLTVPKGQKPLNGWPAILFNHGYIPPEVYKTTERYVAYINAFAKNGYVVFKPDYRGHGSSEGEAEGVYYSPGYTIDVLNALASLKKYPEVNPDKIGMWGHSMGGHIALRSMVINQKDIKAAVLWGAVVAPYVDIMYHWPSKSVAPYRPSPKDVSVKYEYRKKLIEAFGSPLTNPKFWKKLDPTNYIADLTTPIQLHVGGKDADVPPAFTKNFRAKLIAAHKTVAYYFYPNGNHNISTPNFEPAMRRSLTFFNTYLKSK